MIEERLSASGGPSRGTAPFIRVQGYDPYVIFFCSFTSVRRITRTNIRITNTDR